jgi:hypothetical protein
MAQKAVSEIFVFPPSRSLLKRGKILTGTNLKTKEQKAVLADFLKSLAQFFQVVVMLLFVCASQFVSCCYTFLDGQHFYRLNGKIEFFHCSIKKNIRICYITFFVDKIWLLYILEMSFMS